jgi:hypothetical protein
MFYRPKGMVKIRAYVLIRFEAGCNRQVISDLSRLKGLISADLVTGTYDIVVAIESTDMNDIAEIVVAVKSAKYQESLPPLVVWAKKSLPRLL